MTFEARFDRGAQTAWWAPGRVNLIGDHTDYAGGLVLPFATPWGTTTWAAPRSDGLLAMVSEQRDQALTRFPLDSLEPNASRWTAYVEGAAWALLNEGVELTGADVYVDGNVPLGAGLSSSAALTCSTLLALLDLAGQHWSLERVAAAARQVENDYLGAPVGVMDPLVAMHGRRDYALLIDTQALSIEPVPLVLADHDCSLLVTTTHAQHQTSDDHYASRVAEVKAAESSLGVPSLREVTDPQRVEEIADPVIRRRARHVLTENARVRKTVALLKSNQLRSVGSMLTASHRSLRDDFDVSSPELDLAVSAALDADALGARLTGAGFGGSTITLVDATEAERIETAIKSAFDARGWAKPDVRSVRPSGGAHAVSTAA